VINITTRGRKDIKELTIEGSLFYVVSTENISESKLKFRIYSGETKTSYCDIFFTIQAYFGINFHLPSVCSALTKYALSKWDYRKEKQIVTIENGDFLIEKLNLRNITENWAAALRNDLASKRVD
jgi:hypothetical protein